MVPQEGVDSSKVHPIPRFKGPELAENQQSETGVDDLVPSASADMEELGQ